MKRIVKIKSREFDLDETTLQHCLEMLNSLKDEYGEQAKLSFRCDYECDTHTSVVTEREETDEEYSARLKHEKIYKDQEEIRQLTMYNQLKAKFEGK